MHVCVLLAFHSRKNVDGQEMDENSYGAENECTVSVTTYQFWFNSWKFQRKQQSTFRTVPKSEARRDAGTLNGWGDLDDINGLHALGKKKVQKENR